MRSLAGLRRAAAVVVTMWAFAACSGDEGSGGGNGDGSLKALGVDDGASKGASTSQEVTSEKEARLELRTGATLELPKGAVDKATKIGMERPADGKALDLVQRFKTDQNRIASAPYVLTPHGTKFKEEVTLTLPLAKTGSREVSVAWLEDENDTQWKKLGVAKSEGRTAQITLKHFSVIVVIEDASDLPEVEDVPDLVPQPGGTDSDAGDVDGPDAGLGTAGDAAPALDIDASGGAQSDAGAEQPPDVDPRDASDGPGGGDGGTRVDAGTSVPDGSTGGSPDAGDDAGVLMSQYDHLMSCGFVTQEGNFSEAGFNWQVLESPLTLCIHHCFSMATCNDAQIYRCDGEQELLSSKVSVCMADCAQNQPAGINCPNDAGFATRCDGTSECADGSDETNCDPVLLFQCGSGELIPQRYRCDNEPGCSDGSDEQGCFLCDSGRAVAPWHVCNGVADCNDLTDEAGCAEINCPIITQ